MAKAKSDEKDDTTQRDRNSEKGGKGETDKTSRRDDDRDGPDANSDSVELTPVRPKIGESKGNLRQRANYFQKRRQ
jgi:hypothetical protein